MDDLAARYWANASAAIVRNDRAWQELLRAKTRQVVSMSTGVTEVLRLCAQSEDGKVDVEDIYKILSAVHDW